MKNKGMRKKKEREMRSWKVY